MSVIRVDNFGPSAGGTTYSARGIAKAWANLNGTGTIALRDSENVSSVTDGGTGDYTINMSNAFGAADYSAVFGAGFVSTVNASTQALKLQGGAGSLLAGSIRVLSIQTNEATSSVGDFEAVMVTCMGDLA
jgi:hypothetical protein